MIKEAEVFRNNVDAWIKQIRREYSHIRDLDLSVTENTDNIQFNYELIHELREEIEELKKELNMMKVLQIIALKPHLKKEVQDSLR